MSESDFLLGIERGVETGAFTKSEAYELLLSLVNKCRDHDRRMKKLVEYLRTSAGAAPEEGP